MLFTFSFFLLKHINMVLYLLRTKEESILRVLEAVQVDMIVNQVLSG